MTPDLAQYNKPVTHVNWGWCEDVAELSRLHLRKLGIEAMMVKDDDELCYSDHEFYTDAPWSHAWIWVEGKHHDAERPFGVKRWLELPHFKRWLEPGEDNDQVVITPVLPQGEEQTMFYQSTRMITWFFKQHPQLREVA